MNENQNERIVEAMQPIADFFTALHAEFVKMGQALAAAVNTWAQSPEGRYVLAVVRYYEEHPDELDALIAARETEVQQRDCNCLCQQWHHLGACMGEATTDRPFALYGQPHSVPVCGPCADSIDSQRLVPAR